MKKRVTVTLKLCVFSMLFPVLVSAMGRRAPTPTPAEPTPSERMPKIVFDQKEFDFGEARGITKAEHVFTFRNEGDADLHIEKVKSTCGCTAALISEKTIPPGKGGEIKAVFTFGTRQGKQQKHLYVNSNDPAEPRVQLSLTGVIVPPLTIEPRSIHFYDKKAGSTTTVTITQTMEQPLEIKEPTTRLDLIQAVLKEAPAEGEKKRYLLEVSLKPDLQPGRYLEQITLATNLEAKPEVKIPVRITVPGDIEASPARVNLGALTTGQETSREVKLVNRTRKPFKITRVDIDNKDFSVDLKTPTESAPSHHASLRFTLGEQTGAVRAKVVFITDYAPQEKVEVNVYGYIKRQAPRPRPQPAFTREEAEREKQPSH